MFSSPSSSSPTSLNVLSIEVYELFKPELTIRDDVSAAVAKYLDDVNDVFIKSIEEAVRPAVKKSLAKMRRYYSKF
jgi:hypothetical protein